MICRRVHLLWPFLAASAVVAGTVREFSAGHELLRRIRSPLDMARECFPSSYRVPVDLTGEIADQMCALLAAQGLEPPLFEEVMARPGVFALELANENYSLDTREMVSGILNPAEFIDVVLRSIVRYRDPAMFDRVIRETAAVVESAPRVGPAACRVSLRPLGERFGYTYEDIGSHVREGWLTALDAVLDTSDYLVLALTVRRCYREYDIDDIGHSASQPECVNVRCEFAYVVVAGHVLPSELELFINDSLVVTIAASYRRFGRHVVFDKRLVCHRAETADRTCLYMRYGAYRIGAGQTRRYDQRKRREKATSDIRKAAQLSRKAADALRAGSIGTAMRIFERLAREYPDTPQGLESKSLLEGIPKGL